MSEGGDIQRNTGRLTKAGDFDQGAPGEGPEDIFRKRQEANPGSDEFGGPGTTRSEVQDQATGNPGAGDGAGRRVDPRGPGYT